MNKILISELWSVDKLPEWVVKSTGCIYLVTNLVNDKKYVGRASDFYYRWCRDDSLSEHQRYLNHYYSYLNDLHNKLLYKAFDKYGIDKFTVELLEVWLNRSELNGKEMHWINALNTCILSDDSHGYNMTYGGEDMSQVFTSEALEKRRLTNMNLYNGDPYGMIHTVESRRNMVNAQIKKYGIIACHLPKSRRKAAESNKLHHDGALSINTEAARLTKIERYGSLTGAMMTKEAREKAAKSIIITSLFKTINSIIDDEVVDAESYLKKAKLMSSSAVSNIKRVLYKLDILRSSDLWTDKLEHIFSGFRLVGPTDRLMLNN